MSRSALIVVLTAAVISLALAALYVGRAGPRSGRAGAGPTQSPPDQPLPSSMHINHHIAREAHAIQMADLIVHGTVSEIGTSCFDQPRCELLGPVSDVSQALLARSHFPQRFFTVTFQVSETWRDRIGVGSILTITARGDSPVDPPLARQPYELVAQDSMRVLWRTGEEMVLLLEEWPLSYGDVEHLTLDAPWSWQYHVGEMGALRSAASGTVTRSVTITDLRRHVASLDWAAQDAYPAPVTMPTTGQSATMTPAVASGAVPVPSASVESVDQQP